MTILEKRFIRNYFLTCARTKLIPILAPLNRHSYFITLVRIFPFFHSFLFISIFLWHFLILLHSLLCFSRPPSPHRHGFVSVTTVLLCRRQCIRSPGGQHHHLASAALHPAGEAGLQTPGGGKVTTPRPTSLCPEV